MENALAKKEGKGLQPRQSASGSFWVPWEIQKYLQYCWEFHDQLWEALSGTISVKRGVPSRTGGERILEMLWKPQMPWIKGFGGIPAVLSRGIPGNALRAFPGSFRNFSGISSGKSHSYWGYGPEMKGRFRKRVVLANEPSFRFSFRGNMRMYLVPVFVPGEHLNVPSFRVSFRGNIRQNHPFGNHPFVNRDSTPDRMRDFLAIKNR